MQRGDMFVYAMNGKFRPVLSLGPAPCEGGILVVGLSSKDFGELDLPVSGYGLQRRSWVTPQINVFYGRDIRIPLRVFGTLPAAVVNEIEAKLMEYMFGHLLEPLDASISG